MPHRIRAALVWALLAGVLVVPIAIAATSEYLAYNMQIMSLAPEDRAHVEAVIDMGERVSHDEISAMVLFFSPDTFASRAWAHLNQRDDPCAYLRHVAKGDFTFDRAGP